MFKPTAKDIENAQDTVASGNLKAVGYRLIVKPLPSTSTLKAGEKEIAPTLAAMGFTTQSDDQTKRETKGSDVGILCDVGALAWDGKLSSKGPWAAQKDVVVFHRYAGKELELPPGSGDFYRGINDEDLFAKYGES